jgi:hypothetical protein
LLELRVVALGPARRQSDLSAGAAADIEHPHARLQPGYDNRCEKLAPRLLAD